MNFKGPIVPRSALHETIAVSRNNFISRTCKEGIDCWLPIKLDVLRGLQILFWGWKIAYLNLKLHGVSSFSWWINYCTTLITQINSLKKAHWLLYIIDLLLPFLLWIMGTGDIVIGIWISLALIKWSIGIDMSFSIASFVLYRVLPQPQFAFNRIKV